MSKRDESRLLIKSNCESLFSKTTALLLLWATGVGKTINAINLQHKMRSKKTLICVAETAHKAGWKKEFKDHGFEHLLKSTTIICYHSLGKYRDTEYDLVILDEMHHVFTDEKISILSTIKIKKMIGLSATISKEQEFYLSNLFHNLESYKISMEQAIAMELLPKPEIFLVPLELNNKIKSETIEFERGCPTHTIKCDFSDRNKYIFNKKMYPDLRLTISCTQSEKYEYIEKTYWYLYTYKRNACKTYGLKRKNFLSDCKTNHIKKLTDKMLKQRFICFCGSIDQSNSINKNNSINSLSENKALDVLDKFNLKQISSLFAVKMGVEGLNLVDIDAVIIGQLDSKTRSSIQKAGRAYRGQNPKIFILYFKNTKDEEYLADLIDDMPREYIKQLKL